MTGYLGYGQRYQALCLRKGNRLALGLEDGSG